MASQTDVKVRNKINSSVTLNVALKLADGTLHPQEPVAFDDFVRVFLSEPNDSLVITAPEGVDTKTYYCAVTSELDMNTAYSRTNNSWTINTVDSDFPVNVPTTTNVTLAEEEPE